MADRRVSVKIDADPGGFVRGLATASAATKAFTSTLDTSNERATMLTQSVLALGPSLVPIAAAGVPAVTSLAASLGAAAGAAGVAVLAFNGVGDAIKSVREAELEPTAENLDKMRLALEELGPAGASFATFLSSLGPQIDDLQNVAREGLFPGLQEGITSLLGMGPQVENIVSNLAEAMGQLSAEAGAGLSGEGFAAFWQYVEQDAAPILLEFGRSLGNITEGVANLLVGFEPLSSQFSGGLLDMSRSFAEWSSTLESNDSFQSFMAYIERVGPEVVTTFGSLVNMLGSFVQAAAPIGEASLPIIRTLADTLAIIAESPVGPTLIATAAGLSAVSRAIALFQAANATALVGMLGGIAKNGPAAKTSLMGVARSAAVLGAIVYSGDEIIEGLDAISRHSRTAEASMKSLADIQLALAGSNLGKHAEELGIDMQRLAQDLAENGRQGEYVQQVFSDLDRGTLPTLYDSLAGVDDIAKVFGISLGSTAQEASMAGKSLEQLIDNLPDDALDESTQAADDFTESLGRQTRALQENIDAMRAQRTEALAASDAAIAYQQALDDARKALKENGKTLDITTQAGRENRAALNQIAASWNNLSDKQQNAKGAFASARRDLIDQARAFGATREQAERYARKLLEIPPKAETKILVDYFQATSGIELVGRKLAALDGTEARTYITTVYSDAGYQTRGGLQERASGGYIAGPGGPRDDVIPALLSNGEYVIQAAAVARYGIDTFDRLNAMRFASGGPVAMTQTLDQQIEVLRLEQSIRDLTRSLEKNGKDALNAGDRAIAEVERAIATRDLRRARRAPLVEARQGLRDQIGGLRDARSGFSVDGDDSAADIRGELRDFRKAITEAGGRWTKRLDKMGDRLVSNARKIAASERAIEREEKRRDRLNEKLDTATDRLEDWQQTMAAFSQSVAGNFLSDSFNLDRSITSPGAPVAAAPPDPALVAARDQLGAAKSRLQGIYGRTDMDPLQRSYQASKVVAEIAELQSQVDQLDRGAEAIGGMVEPVERTISAVEAFERALQADIDAATEWGDLLDTLIGKGLDPTGGLFGGLAPSADFGLARELAGMTPAEIDQFEQMFARREEAAFRTADRASEARHQETLSILQKNVGSVEKEVAQSNRILERQTERLSNRLERVETATTRGLESVAAQVGGIQDRIGQLERERETNRQKSGDGKRRRR